MEGTRKRFATYLAREIRWQVSQEFPPTLEEHEALEIEALIQEVAEKEISDYFDTPRSSD